MRRWLQVTLLAELFKRVVGKGTVWLGALVRLCGRMMKFANLIGRSLAFSRTHMVRFWAVFRAPIATQLGIKKVLLRARTGGLGRFWGGVSQLIGIPLCARGDWGGKHGFGGAEVVVVAKGRIAIAVYAVVSHVGGVPVRLAEGQSRRAVGRHYGSVPGQAI